jgi:hypothetical protein
MKCPECGFEFIGEVPATVPQQKGNSSEAWVVSAGPIASLVLIPDQVGHDGVESEVDCD